MGIRYVKRSFYYPPPSWLGYNGNLPGWWQVKNVTNGVPQGLYGDQRTAVTLRSASSAGITLASGSYRITTAGTYDSISFDAPVIISATNGSAVFTNCLLRMPTKPSNSGPSTFYLVTCTAAGVSQPEFYDSEFDGAGTWADVWLGPSGTPTGNAPSSVFNSSVGYKVVRCYAHNMTHCFDNPSSGSVIDQCHMDSPIQYYDTTGAVSHNDNVQFYLGGSTGAQLTNSCFDLYNYAQNKMGNTCNLQNGSNWSGGAVMHGITVDSNYFSHGQYLIRLDGMASVDIANFSVTNNRFEINPTVAVNAGRDSRITWTGNMYHSTGPIQTNATTTVMVNAGQIIP